MRLRRHLSSALLISVVILAACGGDKTPQEKPTQGSSVPIARVTVSEARVFEYPSREAETLFRLIEGDQIAILAKTEPDLTGVAWYQVGQGEQFGWVAGSQVSVSGDLALVRTVDASVWSVTPELTPFLETPTLVAISDKPQGSVNVAEAIVLDSPLRNAPEITRLFEGEQVDVLGRVEANAKGDAFYFVGREGFVLGWVLSTQVTLQGDEADIPVLTDADTSLSDLLPTDTPELTATASPTSEPTFTSTPANRATVIATTSPTEDTAATIPPTLTPRISSTPSATPNLVATAQAASTATPIPTAASPSPIPTGVAALKAGQPPPLAMTLPQDWEAVHILVPINSAYLQGELPVSIYQGDLTGDAKGIIWIIWGFPNVTSPTGEVNLYGDGVQLLRGLLFDPETCDIGLGSEERHYKVGGLDAIGTIYSAVDCEGSNDIAGFFATLQVEGGNFAFFVGVEPVTNTRIGLRELQAILDSVKFEVEQ